MPAALHPFLPSTDVQGLLELMYNLAAYLEDISGMRRVTLQPAAGAHGELLGMMLIKAWHDDRNSTRKKVLIPVSAHGTNPASCALCGFIPVELAANEKGCVAMDALRAELDDDLAGIMITNPNTLGIFEEDIVEICDLVHEAGGLVYMDGANLNALMGLSRPGDFGIDVMHFNLHKTFSTPHGGGGPGSGPVGVMDNLEPYLPVPVIEKHDNEYRLNFNREKTVGKLHSFYGNVGIIARAYAYIRSLGPEGLKRITEVAIVNANYIKERLRPYYHLPYDRICKHECVFTDKWQNEYKVKTLDIAKRLIDYGYHPPTVYFPLLVAGALMIEPTESESRESLDQFIDAMIAIAEEAKTEPEKVTSAPSRLPITRLDETVAARNPVLRWTPAKD